MACKCNKEQGITCMLHFDIDSYIIGQALNEVKTNETPDPPNGEEQPIIDRAENASAFEEGITAHDFFEYYDSDRDYDDGGRI